MMHLPSATARSHVGAPKPAQEPSHLPKRDRKGSHPAHGGPDKLAPCQGAACSRGHRAQQQGQPGAQRGFPGQIAHLGQEESWKMASN